MNEELKMILDAMQGLGNTALTGVAWYFVFRIIQLMLCWGGAFAIVVFICKTTVNAISVSHGMETIRDMLGVGCGGYVTSSEKDEVIRKVGKLIQK